MLIAGGLACLALIALEPPESRGTLAWWLLRSAVSAERALPLAALGVALALAGRRLAVAAAVAFAAGLGAGLAATDWLLARLVFADNAGAYLSLPGPIACLAVGLALAAPPALGSWLLLPAALLVGEMQAHAIRLSDPSLHDPAIQRAGVLAAVWLVAAVGLTLWAFRQAWFAIAGRIVGSWLLAIGLLYGGALLLPRETPMQAAAPAQPPVPEASPGPDFNTLLPDLNQPQGGPLAEQPPWGPERRRLR